MLKRILSFLAVIISVSFAVNAQVTTSSITGTVKSSKGDPLAGATITATHVPTGTVYRVQSTKGGQYDIPNMKPGGPYTVEATYVDHGKATKSDINLYLGDQYRVDFELSESGQELKEVVVSTQTANRTVKSGASTNVNNRQITTLPSISRSINDFTRLTPQGGNSSSFNGRDGRYNNITIDGANFNNNFGLSSNNLPGGDAQPISLDAIEQLTVNVSPYDVKQGNFTGAGISAITKSGTNEFHGSAYTFYRDQSFNGRNVKDTKLGEQSKSKTTIFGGRLGGPIIKNKLFFFVNLENETRTYPGLNWMATRPGGPTGTNVSRTTAADLDAVSAYLQSQYGYNTGGYENLGNFESSNTKVLARLDWNISDDHKFSVRYNRVKSTNDQVTNGTSAPNPRASSNRWSNNSMSYANSLYGFEDIVSSWTFDLTSKFAKRINNQFLVTLTNIETNRTSPSTPFPFVDIWDGDIAAGDNAYISFGYELFSWQNSVKNKVYTFTDNVSFNSGIHNFTAGISYDYLYFGNSFLRYGTSYYRFRSVSDFLSNQAPIAYGLTYGYNGKTDPIADLKFGQLALYFQDEMKVTDRFKLLAGMRVDKAIYLQDPPSNSAIAAKTFRDMNGQPYTFDVGSWPKGKLLFSPRVGFNWDVKGNRDIIVRGGTGIFTGRLPFVWYTNQPTNSYGIQATVEVTNSAQLSGMLFNPDPLAYVNIFPQSSSTLPSGASLAIVDKNFVFPQVWRTSLAMDKRLPWNLLLTVEAIYTKDINAILQYNANMVAPDASFTAGPDQRPRFSSSSARSVDASVREAMVLMNTNKGHGFSFSTLLSRSFRNGFYGQISYSFNSTKDLSANPGSQAASAWSNINSIRTSNDLDLALSQYSIPHRVTAVISYRKEYLKKHMATTISLFYEGMHQGRFFYRYSNDMNNDGLTNDLMYIPKDRAEAGMLIPDATQADAFWTYLEQDKYLSKHKGEYAENYGALLPWLGNVDLKFLQDFSIKTGNTRHTLQFSVDILNFGNMLNKNWGYKSQQVVNNGGLLRYTGIAGGMPQFTFNQVSGSYPTKTFQPVESVISTWGLQLGLRYTF
ncbi:MAG TPA: carboxypeptidase regulatory-like domain-containing protein [Chitinophagaceae bacterium]|nr:carboxypeptidase regulatory-like domain-containing protein [Chitinophagaceae bacterium]